MSGLTRLLRNNTWAAIVVAAIATIGLGLLADWQAASLLACVLGCLVMWKSEMDHAPAPELALED